MRKGFISGGSKIVLPREIKNSIGKTGGGFLCIIGRAGVHHNDLIYQARHTVQTSFQYILLIFYDHAQTDTYHGKPPYFSFGFLQRSEAPYKRLAPFAVSLSLTG